MRREIVAYNTPQDLYTEYPSHTLDVDYDDIDQTKLVCYDVILFTSFFMIAKTTIADNGKIHIQSSVNVPIKYCTKSSYGEQGM